MAFTVVPRHGNTLKERMYLPSLIGGLATTFGTFFKNISDTQSIPTLEYPEIMPTDITSRYRGHHRLTHRDDGSIRCVACFMCATACPAQCIFIEAEERLDGVDEKMPKRFDIDLLECIFCGYCVEACPCDAIRMDSNIFSIVAKERRDFVVDKEYLLSVRGGYEPETSQAASGGNHG